MAVSVPASNTGVLSQIVRFIVFQPAIPARIRAGYPFALTVAQVPFGGSGSRFLVAIVVQRVSVRIVQRYFGRDKDKRAAYLNGPVVAIVVSACTSRKRVIPGVYQYLFFQSYFVLLSGVVVQLRQKYAVGS